MYGIDESLVWSVLALLAVFAACTPAPANTGVPLTGSIASDTVAARRLFEQNIDAIHKRDRERYLATYLHTQASCAQRTGGTGAGLRGMERTSRFNLAGHPRCPQPSRALDSPGVVYGTYCYTVTQKDTTSSGVSERVFVKTARRLEDRRHNGVRIAGRRSRAV